MSGFSWNAREAVWLAEEIKAGLEVAAAGGEDRLFIGAGWSTHRPETLARFKKCAETLERAAAMFNLADRLLAEDSFHEEWAKISKDSERPGLADAAGQVQ